MDFQANPFLGVDPGHLPTWIELHAVEYEILGMNAHNLVLNALGEMGVLGGIPLLLIVALLLVRVWRNAWTCKTPLAVALCVSFTAVLLHNMVEASFEGEQFQIVFWIIAALVPPGDERQQIRNASTVPSQFIGALSRGRQPLTV